MEQKKDHTPFLLKVIRWGFPKLEVIAPSLAHKFFVKLFFTPLRYTTPEKERKAETFADQFTFSIEDKVIQGYQWGKTMPYVLVVHGWAGRATQFRRFIKPLQAAGYSVIGFDGPAHGRSSGKKTTITEFEAAIKKIYELKGEPEAIIAHSFGGGAVFFSAVNGVPVKKLINIASPTIGDEIINTYLRTINGSAKSGTRFKQYIQQTFGNPFDTYTASSLVKRLPSPIDLLLVHDENDREVEIKHALTLKEIYPSARLLQTKKLGHTRILKDNDVIRNCVTFIQEGRLS
ncbi:MAG TPA: alpha/beta fold hydrolase [Ohtaekwangia sp.]